MNPIITKHGNPSVTKCRGWLRRAHEWRLVGRRSMSVATITASSVTIFVLRFECDRCGSRAVVNTMDHDVLWQLDVEVPAPEAQAP